MKTSNSISAVVIYTAPTLFIAITVLTYRYSKLILFLLPLYYSNTQIIKIIGIGLNLARYCLNYLSISPPFHSFLHLLPTSPFYFPIYFPTFLLLYLFYDYFYSAYLFSTLQTYFYS